MEGMEAEAKRPRAEYTKKLASFESNSEAVAFCQTERLALASDHT